MRLHGAKTRCFRSLLAIGAISLLAECSTTYSAQESTQLEMDLAKMRHSDRTEDVGLPELETRCLKLIEDHNSPSEKGKIYATVAAIYSDRGYKSSEDPRLAKALTYSRKALEHPLDVLTACEMYERWVGAVAVQSRKYEKVRFVETRRDAIVACLKGLKLALDNGAPDKLRPIPSVPRLDVGREHPQYKQMMEERKQRIAAAEKAEFENELYWQRWTLTRLCITLYSRAPYDVRQFRDEARKILGGHEEAITEIVAQIEKGIAFDKSIHEPDPNSIPKR